jgi:O-antigen/teichoic acid export membrane protein
MEELALELPRRLGALQKIFLLGSSPRSDGRAEPDNDMLHTQSLSSRTFWNASGSLVATSGRMIAAIFIARQLGPELAGRYAFLAWLVEFTVVVASFGLPNALTRYFAEFSGKGDKSSKHQLVRWVTRRYLGLILCGAIAVFSAGAFFHNDQEHKIAVLLPLLLLLQALSALVTAYMAGAQDFRKIAKINLFSGITLVVLQPVFTMVLGLPGALLGAALAYAVSLIWLAPLLGDVFNRAASTVPDSLPKYALYTWLAAVVSAVIWARAELFFLNQYSTSVQAGYFSVGLTLTSFVTMGAALLSGALMPHFSTIVGSNDRSRLQRDYARLTTIVALFALPVSLGGVAVMPKLIPFIFGAAYADAAGPAAVLMTTGILVFAGVGSSLLYASMESAFIFKSGLLGAVLLAVGCYLTAPAYGALGTAWVRLGVQALMIAIGTTFIHRQLQIIPPYRAVIRVAIAAVMAALVARGVTHIAQLSSLAWAVAAGVMSYLFFLRFVQPLQGEDASTIASVTRYLPVSFRQHADTVLLWILRLP